ncbi:MAG: protein kinase [Ruminiclostridium sp.]|nr:protein kinase [Ruminiclostridium sp.]
MAVQLVVIEGYDKDKLLSFEATCSYSVGRGDMDQPVDLKLDSRDRLVSRLHFFIDYRPPRFFIRDNHSTNGTLIKSKNKKNILWNQESEIFVGDLIIAGNTIFRLEMIEPVKTARETPSSVGSGEPGNADIPGVHNKIPPVKNTGPAMNCIDCGLPLTTGMTASELESFGLPVFMCPNCAAAYTCEHSLKDLMEYRILKKIGEGSMGLVFLARQETTGMLAAIKTIIPGMSASETDLLLFEREINIMRGLDHPNITKLYEFSFLDDRHYFISEYMPGGDLLLKNDCHGGRMPWKKACIIVCDILSALHYSHEKGIIHRDIKPSNILLKKYLQGNDVPKLTDFGLAKMYENAGLTNITKTTDRRGTPLFMAPEQFINYRYCKPQADIYSTGIVLYYLLSGSFPFTESLTKRDDPLSFLRKRDPILAILENKPVPVLERNPSIPVALSQIVYTAIRRTPEERFRTAKEMRQAILDLLRSTN